TFDTPTFVPDSPSAPAQTADPTLGAPARAWLDIPTAPTAPSAAPAWSDVPTGPTPDAPSGLAYPAYTPPPPPDEPLLPASYNENELRAAVGATPRADIAPKRRAPTDDDDDDLEPQRGNRKTVLVGATTLIIGLSIAGIVLLGRVNSD